MLLGAAVFSALRSRDQLAVDNDNEPIAGEAETVDVVITAPVQAGESWYRPSTHPVRASFVIPPERPWVGIARDLVVTAVQVAATLPHGAAGLAGPSELVSCFSGGDIIPRGTKELRVGAGDHVDALLTAIIDGMTYVDPPL